MRRPCMQFVFMILYYSHMPPGGSERLVAPYRRCLGHQPGLVKT